MEDKERIEKSKNIVNLLQHPAWKEVDSILETMYIDSLRETVKSGDITARVRCQVLEDIYSKITYEVKLGEMAMEKVKEKLNKEVKYHG